MNEQTFGTQEKGMNGLNEWKKKPLERKKSLKSREILELKCLSRTGINAGSLSFSLREMAKKAALVFAPWPRKEDSRWKIVPDKHHFKTYITLRMTLNQSVPFKRINLVSSRCRTSCQAHWMYRNYAEFHICEKSHDDETGKSDERRVECAEIQQDEII